MSFYNITTFMINTKSYSRLQWSAQEEETLKTLRQDRNIQSWKIISMLINQKFTHNRRTGKQCRERYTNYVRFRDVGPHMMTWTDQQDALLFNMFVHFGPKWVRIAEFLPSKSQNCLKNRFYGMIRKIIRKIKKFHIQKNKKMKKIMKTEYIVRILESSLTAICLDRLQQEFCGKFETILKNNIIKYATAREKSEADEQYLLAELIQQIEEFSTIQRIVGKNKKIKESIQEQRYQQVTNPHTETDKNSTSTAPTPDPIPDPESPSKIDIEDQSSIKPKILETIIIQSSDQSPTQFPNFPQFELMPILWLPVSHNLYLV